MKVKMFGVITEIKDERREDMQEAMFRKLPTLEESREPYTPQELMEKLQEAVRLLREARDFCLDDDTFDDEPANADLGYKIDKFIKELK